MARGEGATTRQMESAPKGSIFVWCNHHLDYPRHLSRKLGREDLEIVSPNWLTSDRWRGRKLPGLVVDHAADLTDEQFRGYEQVSMRVVITSDSAHAATGVQNLNITEGEP